MAAEGVTPFDPASPTGQFRSLSGDITAVPLDPPVEGKGNYLYWGDLEIAGFLAAGSDSVPRAVGFAYMQLAAVLGVKGRSIKTDDLGLVTTQRSADIRVLARDYFTQADEADMRATIDFFEIVPFGGPPQVTGSYPGAIYPV